MPKPTSDFSGLPDYKEAVRMEKGVVIFGSRPMLKDYYDDMSRYDEKSDYFGKQVICEAFREIKLADLQGWFEHCGYCNQ